MRKLFVAKMVMGSVIAILALAIVGGLFFLEFLKLRDEPGANGNVSVHVAVVDSHGHDLFNGTLPVANGTAFDALVEAGVRANFTVHYRDYPGLGLYVDRVGNDSASGANGWLYSVTRDGASSYPQVASNRFALAEGDALVWRYGSEPASPS